MPGSNNNLFDYAFTKSVKWTTHLKHKRVMDETFAKSGDISKDTEHLAQVPESEVRQVKELLQTLLKTKRAFEMYPANNPILLKFQEDLIKRFETFFQSEERLTLIVRQYDIHYKGQPVYKCAEKDDNLALFFYKDGLRELTFHKGFAGDEVMDFINVIRSRPETSSESYDDDIVTLLWEKDFMHLTYYVVDDFAEGDALGDDVEEMLSRRGAAGEAGANEIEEAYKDAADENPSEGSEDQIFTPLEKISMGFHGIFSLGEEEVKSLKEEMESLSDDKLLEDAIYVLFESIYIDRGTPDFDILMNNLDSALNYLLFTGGYRMAALVMRRFRELAAQKDLFSTSEIERIRGSISKAGSDSGMRAVADMLNSGNDIVAEDFKLFLNQLDKAALIPLSNLLGDIQEVRYRKILIDALVTLGRDNIDVLAAGMKDRRWFVVRNVAVILGRIGDKAALEHLKQGVHHHEPKVRREVIRALGLVGGPKAGEILLKGLEDEDPQIRMAALRYLPGAQSFVVLDTLTEIITRPDFSERALAEKRVFFEVLAEVGQERVLQFLVKHLKNRGIFFMGSAKNDELRISAAYGLGNIHSREALEALKGADSKTKKGTTLSEAINYSLNKLAAPAQPSARVDADV